MWEDSRYFWVVHCKNHWFHVRKNLFFRHRIPLAETDAVTPRPAIDCRFRARCDQCGKEYLYKPSEVLRFEQDPPRHSLHIHYFVMKKLACSPRWVSLFELISCIRRCSSLLPTTVQPSFSTLHCKTLNNFSKVCYSLPCLPSFNSDQRSLAPMIFPCVPFKPFLFKRLRTLLHNGQHSSPSPSISSALFLSRRRVYPHPPQI